MFLTLYIYKLDSFFNLFLYFYFWLKSGWRSGQHTCFQSRGLVGLNPPRIIFLNAQLDSGSTQPQWVLALSSREIKCGPGVVYGYPDCVQYG